MRIALAIFLVSTVFAQQQEPFVIRTTTKLVMLNVVAVDKKGDPVHDLQSSDFAISEAGKPQRVATFEALKAGSTHIAPDVLPRNVFSNRAVQHSSSNGVTVILLDYLNTPWSDMIQSKERVLKFLSTVEPEDRIALYLLAPKLVVLHDFTSDTSEFLTKLRNYRDTPGPFLRLGRDPDSFWPVEGGERPLPRVEQTLKALEQIANHISGVPGRKSIVWISGGFPIVQGFDGLKSGNFAAVERSYGGEVYRAARALNNAGVALYPVDARGLLTNPALGAAARGEAAIAPGPSTWLPPNLDSMNILAERTGGKVYYNDNDIQGAIRQVADEGKVTYMLGYYPEAEADGRYREIRVSVKRPGVTLRHRNGYLAARPRVEDQAAVKLDIAHSLATPMDSTTIGLQAQVNENVSTGELELLVRVDPSNLTMEKDGERWKGRLQLVIVQRNMRAETFNPTSDSVQLSLTAERYASFVKDGLLYKKSIPKHPDGTALRIVARDDSSGVQGTLTVALRKVQAAMTSAGK